MSAAERVAQIDLALAGNRPLVWSQDGVSFRAEAIEVVHEGRAISANVLAWTGNGASLVPLPIDNPVILVNPPTLVPDGETAGFDEDGRPVRVPTFRSDPLAAYKQMIAVTVLGAAQRAGLL